MAQPQLEDDQLTLSFKFAFHQKQVSQTTNLKRISDAVTELLNRPIVVKAVHQKNTTHAPVTAQTAKPTAVPTALQNSGPLGDVSSIFNGAELIE